MAKNYIVLFFMASICVVIFYILVNFSSSNCAIWPTHPDYISHMEKSMVKFIRGWLGEDLGKSPALIELTEKLEKRSQSRPNKTGTDPLSLFRAVTSLMDEWRQFTEITREGSNNWMSNNESPRLPKKQDMEDVVKSLFRIQDTYNFTAADIASGLIPGIQITETLTAKECFEIGMIAYNGSDFYHSLMWLQEASSRLETDPTAMDMADILAPLAVSMDKKGNRLHALKVTAKLMDLLDQDEKKEAMFKKYPGLKTFMAYGDLKEYVSKQKTWPKIVNRRLDSNVTTAQPEYEALCRGEQLQAQTNPKLKCFYKRTPAFLQLAPVKAELLSDDPYMVFYRSVITDHEIASVKSLIRSKLQRSLVVNNKIEAGVPSERRTSATGWLYRHEHQEIDIITKRIGMLTDLNMETAEPFQVTHYGIGGHYSTHYDYTTEDLREKYGHYGSYNSVKGDRIATLIIYMNEPEAGGATAFPYAILGVFPSKNDAIFWYNLKKSGKGDLNTLHAGCPVISGEKWLANQWIKERGQEFTRQCGLSEDE